MSFSCNVPVVIDGASVLPSFSIPDSATPTGHDDATSPINHVAAPTLALKLTVIVLLVVNVPPVCRVVYSLNATPSFAAPGSFSPFCRSVHVLPFVSLIDENGSAPFVPALS